MSTTIPEKYTLNKLDDTCNWEKKENQKIKKIKQKQNRRKTTEDIIRQMDGILLYFGLFIGKQDPKIVNKEKLTHLQKQN